MVNYKNHLKQGNINVVHKEFNIATSLNSNEFEKFLVDMNNYDFDVGTIPPGFEHRADLISDLFYGTPTLDWLICWFNNVSDPFQQLNVTDSIKLPKLL